MSAPLPKHSKSGHVNPIDIEPTLLAEPRADDADSLVSSNEPDDLVNEQTWPTEEEMAGGSTIEGSSAIPDATKGTTPKRVRKLPKGTSEYQAAWIIDEDEGEEGEEGEAEGVEEEEMQEEEEMIEMPMKDEEDMETDGRKSVTFEDLDMEEEGRQYVTLISFLTHSLITCSLPASQG